jgi:hypothetical protein
MPLWIFGIILFMPYVAECLVSYICSKKNKLSNFLNKIVNVEKPGDYKSFLITFGLVLLTGLVTPAGFNAYTFFITAFGSDAYSFIGEMKKTVIINEYIIIALILIGFLGLYFKIIKFKFRDLLLYLGLFIFALMAIRNIVYFNFFAPLVLLRSIDYEKVKIKELKIFEKIKKYVNLNLIKTCCIGFMIVMYIASVVKMDYKNYDFEITYDYPVKVTEYIKKNLDYKNLKFYCDYNYGSYLELNDIPVFIDSRSEVYTKEFNGGYDVIEDYNDSNKVGTYKNVFNKYKFDYAVVYQKSDIDYLLILDEDATEVYSEDGFVLYKIKNELGK